MNQVKDKLAETVEQRPPGVPPVLPLSPLPLGARPGQSQAPTCPDQRNKKLSRRLNFPCPSSGGTLSHCIPSVLVPFLQKHLIFQILFVHFVSPSSMKILLLLKSLKREFSKKLLFPPSVSLFPQVSHFRKTPSYGSN